MIVTKYDLLTGKIEETLHGDFMSLAAMMRATDGMLEGDIDGNKFYVLDGSLSPRPIIGGATNWTILANDYETARVTGIPEGSRVVVSRLDVPRGPERDNLATIINDGVFEWSTTQPGRYQVAILPPFPYADFIGEIIANAF